jgi:hypothetical protein
MPTNNSVNEPTAVSGKILQGQGVGNPSNFSTATYPATTTINQILYSSAANTVAGLATANGGVLDTNASGVPSIDTTNFSVLSTGLQLKGNNTNTAPPAGFIGEQIKSAVTGVSFSNGTVANITSISLTAGIWDISGLAVGIFTGAANAMQLGIGPNTGTFTGTTMGDTQVQVNVTVTAGDIALSIPTTRVLLSSTLTYYLIGANFFTTGTSTTNGRISATRVG